MNLNMRIAPFQIPLILLLAPSSVSSQLLLDHVRFAMDEGTWEGCGPTMQVHFTEEITGPLQYHFDPVIDAEEHVILSTVWSVYDGDFNQWFDDTLEHTFPIPGEHLVCLTANALDLNQQPCSTTTCRLVEILQHANCAALEVDFTITDVAGQQITFQDESYFPAGIVQQSWSFSGGDITTGFAPTHTFEGPGPHKVCLTVTGAGPEYCTAQVCKWLYLGPVPVPCEQIFTPGFLMIQAMDMLGVLDTSITSGMHHEVAWDFGDGSPLAYGGFAIHAYATPDQYDLCSTVRYWGPLVADTCSSTYCVPVVVVVATTTEGSVPNPGLSAWPVPFQDQIMLAGLAPGPARIQVFDQGGRLVHEEGTLGTPMHLMDLGHLSPGAYVLRCQQADGMRATRVLKGT